MNIQAALAANARERQALVDHLRANADMRAALLAAPTPDDMVTVAEAARELGRAKSTVRDYCESRVLPATKVNDTQWSISRRDLSAFRDGRPRRRP